MMVELTRDHFARRYFYDILAMRKTTTNKPN